ncbi:TetR/AcrR family transcriptional regulator [Liquorilactobacillus uvarum]|uniref:TetR/AcrR family transcriptional regulator n=1 Tax=Liquorilactobacillus uvarum TaxID=303240 RepID=UPI00288B9A76|nr:TetR/AcrR family transcriptional regulator [Liquorilactobacillus uvarum]
MVLDKREIKTERLIETTFINILSEKDLAKVTVKEICEKALISKSTFYDHYVDKYALLDTIIQEYSRQFQTEIHERFKSVDEHNTLKVISSITQSMASHNKNLSTILKASGVDRSLESNFKKILFQESFEYFTNHEINRKFSSEFLAKMYAEIALASVSFTLTNYENIDLIKQQADFMNLLQQAMLKKI